jgi:hypothetical protein
MKELREQIEVLQIAVIALDDRLKQLESRRDIPVVGFTQLSKLTNPIHQQDD